MSKAIVVSHLTLDGVMQAPGRTDEDVRDGFEQGGWARPRSGSTVGQASAEGLVGSGPMLVGRRTYEDFVSFWPNQTDGNPFTSWLAAADKYVVSTTLAEPLPWTNSTLLTGDAVAAVTKKEHVERDIVVFGSGELVRSLMGPSSSTSSC